MNDKLFSVILFILALAVLMLVFTVKKTIEKSYGHHVIECLNQQVSLYGDLCAESSIRYEDMSPSLAHRSGVICAVESIKKCLED